MTRSTLPEPERAVPERRRTVSARLAAVGVATLLALVPSLATSPAFAAETLIVTAPAEGSTISPFVPTFSGEGVTAGDTVSITYINGAGEVSSATRFTSDPVINDGLTWSAPTNFSDLAPDQTAVTVTVTELDAVGATVSAPVVRSFNFTDPPNPANPFTVTSPGVTETVTTVTPTITGTANPGENITVSVSNIDFTSFVAGSGVVDGAGNFSFALDLSGVVQDSDGQTNVGLNVVRTAADGSALTDASRSILINYAPPAAPVAMLTVEQPAEGSTIPAFVPSFSGMGITAGDTIEIAYVNGAGEISNAARFSGDPVVGDDLSWFTPTNFSDLAPDQTDVTVTVTERDADGGVVGVPVIRSFSFATPPNPANPFTVTSPLSGSRVETFTPTITGTANPGEQITVSVSNIDFTTFIAGQGTVGVDGTFSFVLDLSDVVQDADGETNVGLNTTRTTVAGDPTDERLSPLIVFAPTDEPPFTPNEPSITIVPDTITVSAAQDPEQGVLVTATGFDQNEPLAIEVETPSGDVIVFDPAALEALGGADETGSFSQPLFLFGDLDLGDYTVTITGVESGVTVSDTFELVADAVVTPPTTPAAPTTPAGGASGELAMTGADASPFLGAAALMLIAGMALVVTRRRLGAVASD